MSGYGHLPEENTGGLSTNDPRNENPSSALPVQPTVAAIPPGAVVPPAAAAAGTIPVYPVLGGQQAQQQSVPVAAPPPVVVAPSVYAGVPRGVAHQPVFSAQPVAGQQQPIFYSPDARAPPLAVAQAAVPPGQPPFVGQPVVMQAVVPPDPSPQELQYRIKQRMMSLDISMYIQAAWAFVKPNIWRFIAWELMFIFIAIFVVLMGFVVLVGRGKHMHEYSCSSWRMVVFEVVFSFLPSVFIFYPAVVSLYAGVFRAMRTSTLLKFNDFFSCFQFPIYKRIVGLGIIVYGVATVANLLDCWTYVLFIPAFVFAFLSMFGGMFAIEHQHLTSWTSIKSSVSLVARFACSLILLMLVLFLLLLVGALCLLVGLLVAIPVCLVAIAYCYHHLIGVKGVTVLQAVPVQAVPPPAPIGQNAPPPPEPNAFVAQGAVHVPQGGAPMPSAIRL